MSEPLRIILNPSSGSGAGARLLPRLKALLESRDVRFQIDQTTGPGHARALATAAAHSGVHAVLAAGGDGTIHEVANGLLDATHRPHLGVLPVGTGNDFHRMVGTTRGIEGAIDLMATGTPHLHEVGRVRWSGGERHFVNVLGVGIDAEVLRNRDRFRRLRGLAQYGAGVLAAVARYRPIHLKAELDTGETISDRSMLAAVSVGPSAGGGFRLSPDARPDDGLLDLLFVEALSFLQVARYLPKVVRGTHKNIPVVRMRTLKQLKLTAPDGTPFFFELDGELIAEPTSSLEVQVVPAALSVLKPADAGAR